MGWYSILSFKVFFFNLLSFCVNLVLFLHSYMKLNQSIFFHCLLIYLKMTNLSAIIALQKFDYLMCIELGIGQYKIQKILILKNLSR